MTEEKRVNAAMVFMDIVGFTSMTQASQTNALNLIKVHFERMEPIIKEFNGSVIKSIGDALMSIFPKAEDAVDAAIKMQQELVLYNQEVNKSDQLQMRIGIHYGKVVLRDNDAFGDVVNIASRIEAKSLPEQICVSKTVYDQIKKTLAISARSMGKKTLKNVTKPVHLYMLNPHKTPSALAFLKWPIILIATYFSFKFIYGFIKSLPKNIDKEEIVETRLIKPDVDSIFSDLQIRYENFKENSPNINENLDARFLELEKIKNSGNIENFNKRAQEFSQALAIEEESLNK